MISIEEHNRRIQQARNKRKRGTKIKARAAEADVDFALFKATLVEDNSAKLRAGAMYAAYVAWKKTYDGGWPMGIRAFGPRMRKIANATVGDAMRVTYHGWRVASIKGVVANGPDEGGSST